MTILSYQSAVACGHVGNAAAIFALQRLGFDVCALDTVHFSNHPGHGGWTGRVVPAAELDRLVDGLEQIGALAGAKAVLSGYLGEAQSARPLARAIAAMRDSRPDGLYLCDPVMGDDGPGLYVRPDITQAFAQTLLPLADIVTPNRFELEILAGGTVSGPDQAVRAGRSLLARGPRMVVVTSMAFGPDRLGCLGITEHEAWTVATPRLDFPVPPNGAGDLLSALLLGGLLEGRDLPQALAGAVSSVFAVLETTRSLGRRELALVAAQDQLARPGRLFPAEVI